MDQKQKKKSFVPLLRPQFSDGKKMVRGCFFQYVSKKQVGAIQN